MTYAVCLLCRDSIETLDDAQWEPVNPPRADGLARSAHLHCYARVIAEKAVVVDARITAAIDLEEKDLTLRSLGPDDRLGDKQ